MTRDELLRRMRSFPLVVESTVSASGAPQSAVVVAVVTDEFEIVFDTRETARKAQNLRRDGRVAIVIGGVTTGSSWTVQFEGVADEPQGEELERLLALYFATFPDGVARRAWPGITYFRARPTWIRSASYETGAPVVVEWDAEALKRLD